MYNAMTGTVALAKSPYTAPNPTSLHSVNRGQDLVPKSKAAWALFANDAIDSVFLAIYKTLAPPWQLPMVDPKSLAALITTPIIFLFR